MSLTKLKRSFIFPSAFRACAHGNSGGVGAFSERSHNLRGIASLTRRGGKTGFFWAGFCAICFTWTYFRCPEPKGRTYGEYLAS